MKVEDYEYVNEDLDEDISLTTERKEVIIKKIKDQTIRGKIALNQILKICKNDEEYDFAFKWTAENNITIGGSNITLSGELENYEYLDELEEITLPEPLSKSEQYNLFKQLNEMKKNGVDPESKEYQDIRQKLIAHNMRLALWTVFKYGNEIKDLGFEADDLKQIALESLIKAVDKYEVDFGCEFSTYAVPRIRYSPSKQWRKEVNNSSIKRKEWKMLEVLKEEMLKSENREPTDEEIKEILGIGDKRLESLKNYIKIHQSESFEELNAEDSLVEEPRKTEIASIINVANQDLNKALDTLTDREKNVLEIRVGLKDGRMHSLEEVGKIYRLSGNRIRQIEAKALRKLRRQIRKLKGYTDDLASEEWEKYYGIDENIQEEDQIVDGIKVEKYNLSSEKTKINTNAKTNEEIKEELPIIESNDMEVIEEQGEQEQYQEQLEQIEEVEKYNSEKSYLNEITELLEELDGLDKMLRQASIELKSERNKKQKNKELKEKISKVKGIMQR